MTFALPGVDGSYAVQSATQDHFIHQELIEILYHTLWETVHVFFEHRELGHDVGDSAFLYPFLGPDSPTHRCDHRRSGEIDSIEGEATTPSCASRPPAKKRATSRTPPSRFPNA
jgi:hypothetical protein